MQNSYRPDELGPDETLSSRLVPGRFGTQVPEPRELRGDIEG